VQVVIRAPSWYAATSVLGQFGDFSP